MWEGVETKSLPVIPTEVTELEETCSESNRLCCYCCVGEIQINRLTWRRAASSDVPDGERDFPPVSSNVHLRIKAATPITTLRIKVLSCLTTGCCKFSSADCFQAFRIILYNCTVQ